MRQRKLQLHISRVASLALAVLLLLPALPAALAAEASGSCGEGVTWTLSGGALTVSGSGDMTDYGEFDPAPWAAYGDAVKSVRIENGVGSVGDFAFFQMDSISAVTLAPSVKQVGQFAFYGCSALTLLDLGSVEVLGESAFESCTSLVSVRLPNTLTTLELHAFYRCESLAGITVPSSVTFMGATVFADCTSLQRAVVQAAITELPRWTFYGCTSLDSVTLAPTITGVGVSAFEHCEVTRPDYGSGKTEHHDSVTTEQNGVSVTVNSAYTENENGAVASQVTASGGSATVKVDAVVEPSGSLEDTANKVSALLPGADSAQVTVHLKGDATLSGEDLGRFAGKDVTLTVHTSQGAVWRMNGKDIDAKELSGQYDLSFTLRPLTDPTEQQAAAVGDCQGFTVEFDRNIDFKVEVELPLGSELAKETAVFFAPEEKGYVRAQSVMIDTAGAAHFYLGHVAAGTEYLIGINVPVPDAAQDAVSDVIIPDSMAHEYPNLEQTAEIEYIVTGVKSSWGINMRQLTWIIVAVMGVSVIVVGAVLFTLNKKKLKSGYVPKWDDEDE